MTRPLSEKDVAAYTLVMLIENGVVGRGGPATRAAQLLALTRTHLQDALDRYSRTNGAPPSDVRMHSRASDSSSAVDRDNEPVHRSTNRGAAAKQQANMREGASGTPERRCARCLQWFPATGAYFGLKDRERGWLRSYCMTCWSYRQGETYLNVARREALEDAGLCFVVDEDHDTVGIACADCGLPIEVGDTVHGHVEIVHGDCWAARSRGAFGQHRQMELSDGR